LETEEGPAKCLCDDHTWWNDVTDSCMPCDRSCSECESAAADKCTECYEGAELQNNANPSTCDCKPSFSGDPWNCSVMGCDSTCATCNGTEPTNCVTCYSNAERGTDGTCSCKSGYFGSADNC
jgi:hypothetical protein